MEKINLKNYKIKKNKKKVEYSYQALGLEIADHFKVETKKFWWIFYKIKEDIIRHAFLHCQKESKDFPVFIKLVQYHNKPKEIKESPCVQELRQLWTELVKKEKDLYAFNQAFEIRKWKLTEKEIETIQKALDKEKEKGNLFEYAKLLMGAKPVDKSA